MGRRSKAVQSWIGNFSQPSKNQWENGDDIIDSGDENYLSSNHPEEDSDLQIRKEISDDYGFILFESYESDDDYEGPSDLEEPDDSDLEDEVHPSQEIRNDSNLLKFSAILAKPQKVVIKLEQENNELKPKHLNSEMHR